MHLVFLKIIFGKVGERFHIRNFAVKIKCPNSEHQCLGTCCSSGCCLLCFLAGRGGGVSFKGKGSTDAAMTSGQEADGVWVTGWGERVEGNINPEQTDDLCFIGERESIYVSIWNERRKEETEKLVVFLHFNQVVTIDGQYLSIHPPVKILHCKQLALGRRYFKFTIICSSPDVFKKLSIKKMSILQNTKGQKIKLVKWFKPTILKGCQFLIKLGKVRVLRYSIFLNLLLLVFHSAPCFMVSSIVLGKQDPQIGMLFIKLSITLALWSTRHVSVTHTLILS